MSFRELELASGVLLIAQPMVHEQTFRRTVLLLCEHGPDGSFGLILNRPLDLRLGDVLSDLHGEDDLLSLGGPVHPDTLHFLHRYGDQVPDAVGVLEDVAWGGNFETIKALIHAGQGTPNQLRFFMGYAGWSPGQLEAELEQDAWILAPADASSVFPDDPSSLWRRVLRQMGGRYAVLANFPEDPRLN